jgi:hypothetical protein
MPGEHSFPRCTTSAVAEINPIPMPAAFFLLLAQSLAISHGPKTAHHAVAHCHHGHPFPNPSATPHVKVTIVNATCAPSIALSVSGTNLPVAYPFFSQGEWTANAAVTNTDIHYMARFPEGQVIADRIIRLAPQSSQFLLLTGDLSRRGPSEKLPQLAPTAWESSHPWPPNFQFHVYPVELVTKDPCHYRVVNAMPGKTLTLRTRARDGKPSRLLGLLAPGNSLLLTGQPASIDWIAEIDGDSLPLAITQEGAVGNCLIPFFLSDGKADFVRVFEMP